MENNTPILKDKSLGLFFTRGISLADWQRLGSISREIKPYIELSKYFKKIHFFTYGKHESDYFRNLLPENIEIKSRPVFIPKLLYSFLLPLIYSKTLRQIDFFKTNQMDGSWSAVIAKKLFGKKLIVRCGYEWLSYLESAGSSGFKRKIAYIVEKYAYTNTDKISITSGEGRDFIKIRFGIDGDLILLIGNYVDTDKFTPMPIPKDPKRVIFVGRLEKVKNLFSAIEALSGLGAHLVLIGQGSLRGELEAHAKSYNVSIEFLGVVSQDKLPVELNKSSIFILPSISEGNPKVLIEAMACGLACVGANVSGIREIVNNGKNGVLCEIDSISIREALKSLLEDKDLASRFGQNARDYVVKNFSLEIIMKKEVSMYNSLII